MSVARLWIVRLASQATHFRRLCQDRQSLQMNLKHRRLKILMEMLEGSCAGKSAGYWASAAEARQAQLAWVWHRAGSTSRLTRLWRKFRRVDGE
jgi:hypothetical protein